MDGVASDAGFPRVPNSTVMNMSKSSMNASRRSFMSQVAGMASLGVGAPFALNLAAMGSAAAQSASDYKALVCLFMYGGNDA